MASRGFFAPGPLVLPTARLCERLILSAVGAVFGEVSLHLLFPQRFDRQAKVGWFFTPIHKDSDADNLAACLAHSLVCASFTITSRLRSIWSDQQCVCHPCV